MSVLVTVTDALTVARVLIPSDSRMLVLEKSRSGEEVIAGRCVSIVVTVTDALAVSCLLVPSDSRMLVSEKSRSGSISALLEVDENVLDGPVLFSAAAVVVLSDIDAVVDNPAADVLFASSFDTPATVLDEVLFS